MTSDDGRKPEGALSCGDRENTLQDDSKLSCRSGMVETVLQVMGTPASVESSEECARGRKVASDKDWSCW
jgi:hypothetical protein